MLYLGGRVKWWFDNCLLRCSWSHESYLEQYTHRYHRPFVSEVTNINRKIGKSKLAVYWTLSRWPLILQEDDKWKIIVVTAMCIVMHLQVNLAHIFMWSGKKAAYSSWCWLILEETKTFGQGIQTWGFALAHEIPGNRSTCISMHLVGQRLENVNAQHTFDYPNLTLGRQKCSNNPTLMQLSWSDLIFVQVYTIA